MQSIAADSFDTTTLVGSSLGLSTLLPVTVTERPELTLNSYFGIASEYNTLDGNIPKLRYFGVGIGGSYNADDAILVSAYNPDRTDMNLYRLIPIRCRPVDEDLSDLERKKYRLRLRKTMNDGNDYYLYYLKVLDFDDEVKFKKIDITSGAESAYELSKEFLDPVPQKPGTSTTIETADTSIVAYCDAKVTVDAKEVLEYINVAFNGDTRYARISEIGFFTGVDKVIPGTTMNGSSVVNIQYTESCYTQLYNHATWLGTSLSSEGLSIESVFQITSTGSISES
ncbi:MAG: hypothetical protein SOV61_01635 [Lachnospiraceae bacterium]|nr:hypothetical protein [Lachnospiraceae bacterium]